MSWRVLVPEIGAHLLRLLTGAFHDPLGDVAQHRQLLRRQGVEQHLPHTLHMAGGRCCQGRHSSVGEHREEAAAVLLTALTLHPTPFLEPVDSMGQLALSPLRGLRQLAHPQRPTGSLRQLHEDLVVSGRNIGVGGQLPCGCFAHRIVHGEEGPPDPLLLIAQPTWLHTIRLGGNRRVPRPFPHLDREGGTPGSAFVAWKLPASKMESMPRAQESRERSDASRNARLPKVQRREQLLAAAREVFVSVGYHAAAMDDIAAQAGVTKPVLYQHFASKRDLYLAILDEGARRFLHRIRTALRSTDDNQQRVYQTIRAFFQFVAHDDADYRLLFESDLANLPEVERRTHRVADQCAEMVAEVIAEDTSLDEESALLLANGLLGLAQVSAQRWLRGGKRIPADEAAGLLSGLAWQGISEFPLTKPLPQQGVADQPPEI